MGWTLDQAFFRRLVGFYMLSIPLAVGATVYETLGPGWKEFSNEFDCLAERHFGAPNDTALVLVGPLILWHFASLIGLMRFKPWARWGFWVPIALAAPASLVPGFASPSFTGSIGSYAAEIGAGLFGAIILVAYSTDHGGMWFKGPLEKLKETF